MDKGWIKLHREILEKPIWTGATPEQKVLLVTLLMMANHSEKEWEWQDEKFLANPGQFVTSLKSIVEKSGPGVSLQNVRTALARFEKYDFLTSQSTNRNRLITIVNWTVYQGKEERSNNLTNKQLTGKQQAANKQLTTNKNVKNEKNEKNEKKSNSRKHIYDESSIFYQLALEQYEEINKNHPERKEPNLQKWANDFRLIIERDQRTVEQIRHLVKWIGKHAFWHAVILSPTSIRRNWDQMVAQIKKEHASAKRATFVIIEKVVDEFELDLTKGESL